LLKGQQRLYHFQWRRRLAELNPNIYTSLEALGICVIDAGGEMSIPDLANLYRELGKRTFAISDKQCDVQKALIEAQVETLFMLKEKLIEEFVLENTTDNAMNRFLKIVNHPQTPHPRAVLREYFYKKKEGGVMPDFLR